MIANEKPMKNETTPPYKVIENSWFIFWKRIPNNNTSIPKENTGIIILKINEHQLDLEGKIKLKFWLAIYELYFGDFESGEEMVHQLENVQRLLSDRGKLNLRTIFDIRRKDAINYRKNIQ